MSRGYFTFDGHISSTYGVLISGDQTFNAPVRDVDDVEIPGRDGSLTLDNGRFDSIEHVYEAFIVNSFQNNVEQFRNILMSIRGKARLSDSYHPDEFYLARYEGGLAVKTNRPINAGSFDIKFIRDPRRFLVAGETAHTLTTDGTIINPTLFESKPLIRVTGTGTIGMNGVTISISQNSTYIDIDCEMQDCYCGTTNCNSYVTFSGDDFPTLAPGSNTITLTDVSEVVVTPNWYIL